jgi:hypothetical protein
LYSHEECFVTLIQCSAWQCFGSFVIRF